MNLGLSLSLAARAVRAITKVNKKTGLLSIKVGAEVRMVPWVPTGDWSFKATVNPTVPGCHFLSSENSEGRVAIADSGVIAGKNVSPPNFGDVLTYGFDGQPHVIEIAQVGTTLSAYVDGEPRGEAAGFVLEIGTVDRMFAKWGGATSVPPFYGTVEDVVLTAAGLSDRTYALELIGENTQPDTTLPDEPVTLLGVDHEQDWEPDQPIDTSISATPIDLGEISEREFFIDEDELLATAESDLPVTIDLDFFENVLPLGAVVEVVDESATNYLANNTLYMGEPTTFSGE